MTLCKGYLRLVIQRYNAYEENFHDCVEYVELKWNGVTDIPKLQTDGFLSPIAILLRHRSLQNCR